MAGVFIETHDTKTTHHPLVLWSNSRVHFLQCYQHIAVFPNEGPCCLHCPWRIQSRSFATQASRKLPQYGAVGHWTTDFLPTAELGLMKMVLLLISWWVWLFLYNVTSLKTNLGLDCKNAWAERKLYPFLSLRLPQCILLLLYQGGSQASGKLALMRISVCIQMQNVACTWIVRLFLSCDFLCSLWTNILIE